MINENGTEVYHELHEREGKTETMESDLFSLTAEPFRLRVVHASTFAVPGALTVSVNPRVKAFYESAAKKALAALKATLPEESESLANGRNTIAKRIESSLQAGEYATLRHLLYSYHTCLAENEK